MGAGEIPIRECGEKENRGSGAYQHMCRCIVCSLEHVETQNVQDSEELRAQVLDSDRNGFESWL